MPDVLALLDQVAATPQRELARMFAEHPQSASKALTALARAKRQASATRRGRTAQGAFPPLPAHVTTTVRERSHGRCVVCGERGHHCHHILPQSKWPDWRLMSDLIVLVCRTCHANHHAATRRIPLRCLPDSTYGRVYELAGPAACDYLARAYPST